MSLKCPHCGGAIEPQISLNAPPQIGLKSAADEADLRIGFQDLKQEPSPNSSRSKEQYLPQFERFWDVFPIHRGKKAAQKSWLKAASTLSLKIASTKGGLPAEHREEAESIILLGAMRYRDDPGRDPTKTKYAEGWLSGERWEDEPTPTNGSRSIYARLGVPEEMRP